MLTFVDDDGEGALSKAIAAHLKPVLVSTWEKVKQASFTAAAEERRQRAENLQKNIDEVLEESSWISIDNFLLHLMNWTSLSMAAICKFAALH